MLNAARHHRAARRSTAAARAQLSRLPLVPGMAARVDHRHDRTMGHLVTITAWWDHPVTGARFTVEDTVPAVSGPHAAEQAAYRTVSSLLARLRADRVEADA